MKEEQKATAVAGAGATAGGVGAVGAVAALGIPGLGATGITSGLATVGSIVGGGMGAGLLITAAAPLAVGVVSYVLYKWLKK